MIAARAVLTPSLFTISRRTIPCTRAYTLSTSRRSNFRSYTFMHPFSRNQQRAFLSALLSIALAVSLLSSSALAWQQSSGAAAAVAAKPGPALTAAERKAARVKLETIRDVTSTLSSPQFEGRGTGQPGADRAAQYIADRFAKIGLKPAG